MSEMPPPVCAACLAPNPHPWVVYTGGLVVHHDYGPCERYAARKGLTATGWQSSKDVFSAREIRVQKASQWRQPERKARPDPTSVMELVAGYFHVEPRELIGPRRSASIAYPRHLAMYLCRELTDMSTPQIGGLFGGRDHTTVLYAIEKIEAMGKRNPTRDHLSALRYLIASSTG